MLLSIQNYDAYPGDTEDFYYFNLEEKSSIAVQVTDYTAIGQLLVYYFDQEDYDEDGVYCEMLPCKELKASIPRTQHRLHSPISICSPLEGIGQGIGEASGKLEKKGGALKCPAVTENPLKTDSDSAPSAFLTHFARMLCIRISLRFQS